MGETNINSIGPTNLTLVFFVITVVTARRLNKLFENLNEITVSSSK